MRRYGVLVALLILCSLAACTVIITPSGTLILDTGYIPVGSTWGYPTPFDPTPTQQNPTETVVFPTPRPLTLMVNITTNRYSIRQCPDTTCTRLGWLLPGEQIEADEHTATADWLQVFRDDVGSGWVWRVALGHSNG